MSTAATLRLWAVRNCPRRTTADPTFTNARPAETVSTLIISHPTTTRTAGMGTTVVTATATATGGGEPLIPGVEDFRVDHTGAGEGKSARGAAVRSPASRGSMWRPLDGVAGRHPSQSRC